MATLTIRNLPDEARDRLRLRAARAGTSMEAEAREILVRVSAEPLDKRSAQSLQEWVDHLYGERRPVDAAGELIRERRAEAMRDEEKLN